MEQSSRPLSPELAFWRGVVAAIKLYVEEGDPTLGSSRREVLKYLTKDLIKRDKEEINVCNVAQD